MLNDHKTQPDELTEEELNQLSGGGIFRMLGVRNETSSAKVATNPNNLVSELDPGPGPII